MILGSLDGNLKLRKCRSQIRRYLNFFPFLILFLSNVFFSHQSGNDHWLAPEYRGGNYTPQCDVFSYGVVLYEIATHGELPFRDKDRTVSQLYRNGQRNEILRQKKDIHEVSFFILISLLNDRSIFNFCPIITLEIQRINSAVLAPRPFKTASFLPNC